MVLSLHKALGPVQLKQNMKICKERKEVLPIAKRKKVKIIIRISSKGLSSLNAKRG